MTVSGISAAEMPGSATTMWISHLVSDTNDGGSELKMSNNLRGTQTHTKGNNTYVPHCFKQIM